MIEFDLLQGFALSICIVHHLIKVHRLSLVNYTTTPHAFNAEMPEYSKRAATRFKKTGTQRVRKSPV
jgi:hypothetical protein